MSQLSDIHLCIVQPQGYVHSLGFIDPARYFRHQFRRFGARVSVAKNRLRHDAVNFVFGAHLGFDPAQRERQHLRVRQPRAAGRGRRRGAQAYLNLLASSAVVDYDADNVAAYAKDVDTVPVVPMLYAPYLADAAVMPLAQRPIDLLFIGSMNPRRRALIERIEAHGVQVAMFDSALYGEERDHFITQAKAVLNIHFYDSSRFEQVRVSHCLSLGTPVISERGAACRPHAAFDDCVQWFDECSLEHVFAELKSADFADRSQAALERFRGADPVESYGDLLAFAAGFGRAHHERRPQTPWRPTRIHIGSGKDYKPGWLNVDVLARAEPDLVLDLSGVATAACRRRGHGGCGATERRPGRRDRRQQRARARGRPAAVDDPGAAAAACRRPLEDRSALRTRTHRVAGPDPRACDERELVDLLQQLVLVYRLVRTPLHGANVLSYLDRRAAGEAPRERRRLHARPHCEKVMTTPRERMTARTMSATLDLPDDALDAAWLYRARAATAQAAVIAPATARVPRHDAQAV